MASQELLDRIATLSPDQQTAVEQFIDYLKKQSPSEGAVSFRTALDSFVAEHSDLLRRLAG